MGDWSLKPVAVGSQRFVVGVNENTFLAVVFDQTDLAEFATSFGSAVETELRRLGVPEPEIAKEAEALETIRFSKNRNRSLVGILNEVSFQFELEARSRDRSLPQIRARLNKIPHRASTSNCVFACDAVEALLGAELVN